MHTHAYNPRMKTHSEDKQDPAYQLEFRDRGDYLRAQVDGPKDSLEICIAYWKEIAAECERRGTPKLLVIDRLLGEPVTAEELAQLIELMRGSFLERVRIAFHESTISHLPLVERAELTARELGFTVRVFADEQEAELWLRYGET